MLSTLPCEAVTKIALERPSSLHKLLPNLADGWLLDSYFVGPENQQLRFLFDGDQIRSLESLSPVVLYGEKSLGKTALIVSLAVQWSKLTEQRPVVITTGHTFCRDFADAIEADDIEAFRKKHRQCKMMVIDDLEPLKDKQTAQEELAATLDALSQASRPVLISNQLLPAAAKYLKSNLAGRLSAGYSLQLNRPGQATRQALIEAIVAKVDPLLSIEQVTAIATGISSSAMSPIEIRDLVKVAHQSRIAKGEVDPVVVAALVREQLVNEAPDISTITKIVCRRMQVKLVDVRGTSREASIMRARSVSIYLARKLTKLSLLQIGEYFSGRDHSTVLHSVHKIEALINNDSELANLCRDVEAELLSCDRQRM